VNAYKDIGNVLKGNVRISSVTIGQMIVSSATIKGTMNGTAACAGCVGEVISSVTAVDAYVLTSAAVFDVAVLLVPPGCWLLIGQGQYDGSGALGTANTNVISAISLNSGNTLVGTTYGLNKLTGPPQSTSAVDPGVSIAWPQCVSTATNYYLKADAVFTGGTSFGFGALQAVRIN
jgi:hypothetical protein